MIVSRGSNPLRDPGRILATPEFKVNDRHRTRTESELTLSTMLADFDPKYPSTRAYFPSERLLATPKVLIPFAPPASQPKRVISGIGFQKPRSDSRPRYPDYG